MPVQILLTLLDSADLSTPLGCLMSWFYTSSLQRHCPLEEWLVTAREQMRNVITVAVVSLLLGICFHAR